jgi:hypothetical protein
MAKDLGNYEDLLREFLKYKYKFVFFDSLSEYNCICLRHDIDFDCKYALDIAEIEHSLGIKSTFFFLITNQSYNLFTYENMEIVKRIKEMGHRVSIHFDMSIYDNIDNGLEIEVGMFEKMFNQKVDIISIHKPTLEILESSDKILKVAHTYLREYFSDTYYCSDSGGKWFYGSPLDSDEFKNKKSMQLLIHPIWWADEGKSVKEIFDIYLKNKSNESYENVKEIMRKNRDE